jgi:hypothetical protein
MALDKIPLAMLGQDVHDKLGVANPPITQEFTSFEGQTVFNLTNSYTIGNGSLIVEIDGITQPSEAYTETSTTSITLSEGLPAGAKVRTILYYTDATLESELSQISSSLAEIAINVKSFGAKGDGLTDDTNPIQNALNSGAGIVLLPKGTYKITQSLTLPSNTTMVGAGRNRTIIIQFTNNIPIVDIGSGQYKGIKSMKLKFNAWQSNTQTNAKGIGKTTNDALGQSIFHELEIEGAYDGVYSANQFYSNTISDLWIHSYSRSAMYLEGTGGTGCVLSNIYTTNWNDYVNATKNQADYAFFFKGFSESSATQLNIEHSKLLYGIYLNAVDNFDLTSIHVEGYEQRGDNFSGVIGVQSSQVNINGLTMGFSWKDTNATLTTMNLFALKGNAKLSAKNIITRDNSVVWGVQRPVSGISTTLVFTSDNTSSVAIENHTSKDGYFKSYPAFDINSLPPVILRYNNRFMYQEQTTGSKAVHNSVLPTAGKWSQGDKVYNTSPVSAGYEGWICTQGGIFNAAATGVTGTSNFQSAITVNQQGSFVVGDWITITGATNNYQITSIYNGGLTFGLGSTVNANVTNAVISYATPIFKTYGLIS